MGLFSRFNAGNANPPLHSSGIVGDDAGMGVTSRQSFQQRKAVEHSRQHVGNYRNAGVLHTYRQGAQRPAAETAMSTNQGDRYIRGQTAPQVSRIDIVKVPNRGAASFREPQQRGYNPYS